MSSTMGTLPVIYVLLLTLAFPPALCLWTGLRKFLRARERRRPASAYKIFTGVGAVALAFNVAVATPPIQMALDGLGYELGWLHLVALCVSWLCLWAWFVMTFLMKRRRFAY